ncbi:ubiquitin supergroup [Purpureocillium lilacinum]|uniref:Ubiquitin supergroup n=1 Tax=Purpureocillium lilacinum TaxID=33203 RepID=A0A179F7K6_PURLI|nr:ubiquitin supergroup [Purpureocillium lilacinum]
MVDGAAASPPKKLKRLPFKPTALRKTSSPKLATSEDDGNKKADGKGDNDDALALFRRAKEMEPIMEAERARMLKKKQQREGEKRKRASIKLGKRPLVNEDDDKPSLYHGSPMKEPRATAASDVIQGVSGADPSEKSVTMDKDRFSNLVTPPASKRSRIEFRPSADPIPSFEEAGTVAADSDSDSNAVFATPPKRRRNTYSIEVVDDCSSLLAPDDEGTEFEEYVRKAEQQRARDQATLESCAHGGGPAVKEKVEVVVTSNLPNCIPLRARVLYTKQLKIVRDTWIAMQRKEGVGLIRQQPDDFILTWRRKRVYVSSTLLHLGIRPRNGRIWVDGRGKGGLADNGTRVHLEMWTPELFWEMERDEELRRQREAGELSESEYAGEEPAPEIKIRVILEARGFEVVKLTVRPQTMVKTLVTGFRAQRGIGLDKQLRLRFDGDWLHEHVTMEEAEVDDLNKFEVHFR